MGKNLKKALNLSDCRALTHKSVLSVIDGLAEVEEEQTLWISEESYNTLSKDEIKKAENKNWKVIVS